MRAEPQHGAAALVEQQRAVAEVIAAMQIARGNPRDPVKAMDLILTDCTMVALAEDAIYSYARGGTDITGPSIRLAEAIARRWGNMTVGVRELGRREGYSEVMAYAVDLESGFRDEKLFQVRHWRDTKKGGYALTDERDLYEALANTAARRKRACILAVVPQDVIEAAVRQCELTMKSKIEITPEFTKSLLDSFEKFGVTQEMIEKRIQRRLDALTPALAVNLRKIHNSLRDGMSNFQDWFEAPAGNSGQEAQGATRTDTLAADLARRAATGKPKAEKIDQATGEVFPLTVARVRESIELMEGPESCQAALADVMKLPANDERSALMKAWNERVMALAAKRDKKDAAPQDAAPPTTPGARAPATVDQPRPAGAAPAKPKGTKKIRDQIVADLKKATTSDAAGEIMAATTLYDWSDLEMAPVATAYDTRLKELEP
jgi:hypothetical protein